MDIQHCAVVGPLSTPGDTCAYYDIQDGQIITAQTWRPMEDMGIWVDGVHFTTQAWVAKQDKEALDRRLDAIEAALARIEAALSK